MANNLPAQFKLAMFKSGPGQGFGAYFRYDNAQNKFVADTDVSGAVVFYHPADTEHVYIATNLGNLYLTWDGGYVVAQNPAEASSIHTQENNQGAWNFWFPNKVLPNGWGLNGSDLAVNQSNTNYAFAVGTL